MTAERFRKLVARHLGLVFDDSKLGFLAEVLERLADRAGLGSDAYLDIAEGAPSDSFLGTWAAELTVGETYFFRNRDQFRALVEVALPGVAAHGRRPLRFLSAGCASGDEAHTIAMLVAAQNLQVDILGVDINPAALARARSGRYSSWALRETPDEARRWFRPDGRDFMLDDSIRAAVRFEQRNLVTDEGLWAPHSLDVVFCRNVIMYFAPETQAAIVGRIERALVPGGYLFLGHAETLRGLSDRFHLCHTNETFYYRRRTSDAEAKIEAAPPAPSVELADSTSWVDAIQHATDRIRAITAAPGAEAPSATSPHKPPPPLRQALLLLQAERYAEALALLGQVRAPYDREVLLLQAVLLVHAGRLAEAEVACRLLLGIDELNAGAHYVLAMCREGVKDTAGAADHDQTAVYLDPSFAMPRLHLGIIARRAGDHGVARRELREALQLLQREDSSRIMLFGGGFQRDSLIALCRAELARLDRG